MKKKDMKTFLKKHILTLIFTVTGAAGGFLYWRYIGCASGTCFIKSVWYMSTLYGMLLGYITGGLVEDIAGRRKNSVKSEGKAR
jgi:hypothetical protein